MTTERANGMMHARPTTLRRVLLAATRVPAGAAAAVLVFNLVLFSPLVEMKGTIAAAAESSRDGNGGRGNDRGGGNSREDDNRGKDRSGGRDNNGNNREGRGKSESASENTSSGSESKAKSDKAETTVSDDVAEETEAEAERKGRSLGNNLLVLPRRSKQDSRRDRQDQRFTGDSSPDGAPLSAKEEREAIRRGWR